MPTDIASRFPGAAYIDPTARVFGKVEIGEGSSLWPSVANRVNAMLYHRNALAYARGEHRAWDGPDYEAAARQWKREAERQFADRYGS